MADTNSGLTFEELGNKDIFELLGFTTLSEERKKALLAKFETTIGNRVAARIYDLLKPEERDEYSKLLNNDSGEAANEFLLGKDIDAKKMYFAETLNLKLELYEDSKIVRQKSQQFFDEELEAVKNEE
jgi:hypothetical protein